MRPGQLVPELRGPGMIEGQPVPVRKVLSEQARRLGRPVRSGAQRVQDPVEPGQVALEQGHGGVLAEQRHEEVAAPLEAAPRLVGPAAVHVNGAEVVVRQGQQAPHPGEVGVVAGESLEATAQRELAEEAGYEAGRLVPLGTFHTSKSILREVAQGNF